MTTTIGRWIELPTSGGIADRFGADEPGGSGLFQIAASNATLASRENGLRSLWEARGSDLVWDGLGVTGDVTTFLWSAEDTDGVWARYAGAWRVRLHGETARAPRLHLAVRALAPSPSTTGIVLAVSAPGQAPSMRSGTWASATTTSTTPADLSVVLALTPDLFVPEGITLGAGDESGQHTLVAVWVGAWCTSGSSASKGAVYAPSLFLREPA